MPSSNNSVLPSHYVDRSSDPIVTVENEPTKTAWKSVIEIHQIGETYTEQLEKHGVYTIRQFSNKSVEEICDILGITTEFSEKLQSNAQELLNSE